MNKANSNFQKPAAAKLSTAQNNKYAMDTSMLNGMRNDLMTQLDNEAKHSTDGRTIEVLLGKRREGRDLLALDNQLILGLVHPLEAVQGFHGIPHGHARAVVGWLRAAGRHHGHS